jgi:type I restriction enzyme, S subunit
MTGWVMSKGKPLVPKLRFPEFRKSEGWEVKPFQKLFTIGSGRDYKHLSSGTVPVYGSGGYMLSVDDFLYDGESVCIGRKGTINNPMFLTGKFWTVDTLFYTHSFQQCLPKFILSIFQNIDWLKHNEAGGVPSLSKTIIEKIQTAVPKVPEQQRIADCLSSLDKLIAGQARKVDALKTHKKGLMQQLFPREGETQPYLRFPEFRDAGDWDETRLGQMGDLVSGLTYSPGDVRDSGLLVLRSSNVQDGKISLADCVYVDPNIKGANLSITNDILICVRNGSAALIGKNALIPEGMPLCTHGAFMTVFRSKSPEFVFQLLQTEKYQTQVAGDLGATINSINGSQLVKYKFIVPKPEEQQKIAELLASIDHLIADQAQELDFLKTQKKGLMQQLFPSAEALEA